MKYDQELPDGGQASIAYGPVSGAAAGQAETSEGQAYPASQAREPVPSDAPLVHQRLLGGGPARAALSPSKDAAAEQPETLEGLSALVAQTKRIVPSDAPLSDCGHAAPASSLPDRVAVGQSHESEGHLGSAVKANQQVPSGSLLLPEGHEVFADQARVALPSGNTDTINLIRALHRDRSYAMEQRKRADLALGSFLRIQLGWSPDLPKVESEAIKAHTAELIESGEKELVLLGGGKLHTRTKPPHLSDPAYINSRDIILASVQARAPFDRIENGVTKQMERLAETLPVWECFGKNVRGFSTRLLAVLVGEAGDPANYTTHSKLWKRMGVAVMGDVRQGGLTKGASKEDWIAHGYNRKRRAHLYVIGASLIKAADKYYQVYLARKDYERRRAEAFGLIVAPSAKIPKKRAAEFISDGHIHKRAQRYMEKKLLRDLWRAWTNERKAILGAPETAELSLPSARLTTP